MQQDPQPQAASDASLIPAPLIHPAYQQASSDDQLVRLWLTGRPEATIESYSLEIQRLFAFLGDCNKSLQTTTLADLQDFMETRSHLEPSTQNRTISALKSLWSFALRLGYVQFNVAAPIRNRRIKDTLAERILEEQDVLLMIRLESNPRDRAILLMLYGGALRAHELCNLKWRDLAEAHGTGVATIFGKGGKTRFVKLPRSVWEAVSALRSPSATPDDPVFVSRKHSKSGGHLNPKYVTELVKKSAKRIGKPAASAHWLRHAHATHSQNRGAPVHVTQKTLGHSNPATTMRYSHIRPDQGSGDYLPL